MTGVVNSRASTFLRKMSLETSSVYFCFSLSTWITWSSPLYLFPSNFMRKSALVSVSVVPCRVG